MLNTTTQKKNTFGNYKKVIELADSHWGKSTLENISNLDTTIEHTNQLKDQHDRTFHHFCTTSYLELDYYPALL